MRGINFWALTGLIAGMLIASCTPGDRYERILKRELAGGDRTDSLFMGLYLGMPQKDFYTHCWKLNRQGLVRQGTSNTSVEYQMKDELNHPATMNFYPLFYDEKIAEMPVRFVYNGWSPWNKELSAESLSRDVKRWLEQQYGRGFITVKHPEGGTAYIKIDDNRRITIYTEQDIYVWAVFTDMLSEGIQSDTTESRSEAE